MFYSYLLAIAVICAQGLCDDGESCDPCLGYPVFSGCSIIFETNCTCLGSTSFPWCFTREDMTEWRYCTAQDRDQGFSVPLHCVPIDCVWTSWSEWSGCETEISTGGQFRFRTRDEIKEVNGGKPCYDSNAEVDNTYCNAAKCPTGYTRNGTYCYKSVDSVTSWNNARQLCQSDGSDLAWIDSQAENDFISTIMQLRGCNEAWIGLTNVGSDWHWSSTGKYPTFTTWIQGQPDNGGGNEHCVEIWDSYLYNWNDRSCDSSAVTCGICKVLPN